MKKLVLLVFALLYALVLVGCKKDEVKIGLVTDVGTIDDESFNQAAWNGVEEYAEANDISYAYYQPAADSDEERLASIRQAVNRGAEIIICPGYMFAEVITESQTTYPDVKFVFLDGTPNNIQSNVHSILYKEEQAGFLAGYAIVKDGYRELGFLGGSAVPAVQRYGYGFVQGAEYAAKELDVDVNLKYTYGGQFYGDPNITANMEGWYSAGTEVVFACGGGIYTSAVEAAKKYNGKVIGVDTDQAYIDPDIIITSAMKKLKESVIDTLTSYFEGNWDDIGGKVATLGLSTENNFVGLPTNEESWRFNTFTVAEYNTVVNKIIDGTIAISDDTTERPTVTRITVDYIE